MLIEVNASEAAVLELRNIPLVYRGDATLAPAWAAMLAACEVHDWWAPGALRACGGWPNIWSMAEEDSAWRTATSQLTGVAVDPRDPFFRAWVDAWLSRTIGIRCYGPDSEPPILQRVRPREP